jgi:uncharacterized membrane protein YbaN (DUF454 family)
LGIVGIFVPLLPTTPFLLLSAALFARSSQRLYNWLINHRVLGTYIRNFRENKAISLGIKICIISIMWLTTLLNVLIFVRNIIWVQILLILISIGVTLHILSFNTRKK